MRHPLTPLSNKFTPLFGFWPRIGERHAGYGTQIADHPITRCPPLCHYSPHCFASFAVVVSWGTWASQVHWPHIDGCLFFFRLLLLLKLELAADFQMTPYGFNVFYINSFSHITYLPNVYYTFIKANFAGESNLATPLGLGSHWFQRSPLLRTSLMAGLTADDRKALLQALRLKVHK